jgi:hypothetical protein
MAALADGETVKAPGTLVVSGYCTTPDFSKKVTPDLKGPLAGIASTLLLIDLGANVRCPGPFRQLAVATSDADNLSCTICTAEEPHWRVGLGPGVQPAGRSGARRG